MTFVFFTLFPLTLLFCQSFWPLVAVFVLRGLKEFGDPTRKALIMDLAPEDQKALTFGVYYLVRDAIVSVAAFGGAFLWLISPATNFLTPHSPSASSAQSGSPSAAATYPPARRSAGPPCPADCETRLFGVARRRLPTLPNVCTPLLATFVIGTIRKP